MKVTADKPVKLVCLYWGSDVGRTFDIEIDGHVIATQKLESPKPGMFFSAEYRIPTEITKGKDSVTVTFKNKGGFAGGVFGCLVQEIK